MLSLNVSQVLVGHNYRSTSRGLSGEILQAELFDKYDNTYKIRFKDYATSTYHWATIQVLPDEN